MNLEEHLKLLRNALYITGCELDEVENKIPNKQYSHLLCNEMKICYNHLIHTFKELEELLPLENENIRKITEQMFEGRVEK